jgi:hypothetical protein
MDSVAPAGRPVGRGRLSAALGIASAFLLLASFRWAHHWGSVSVTIVAAWALATLGALVVSIWSLCTTARSRRLAALGIALALVSVAALAFASVLAAAGVDAGDCGGG